MAKLRACFLLLRPQQWLKNVFVLMPLVFSQELTDINSVLLASAAFAIYCMIASVIYIVNDWRDIEADRAHPKKRNRPLASGAVTQSEAAILIAALAGAIAVLLALVRPNVEFLVIIVIYAAFSLSYSFGLKHVSLLEMFIVTSGYVFRVLAGSFILGIPPSGWILACTGLVAFLITAGKRRADLDNGGDNAKHRPALRGYTVNFLDQLISISAGMTVITYIMFTISDYAIQRFGTPSLEITSVFVCFGIFRYLQIVMVEKEGDDPTVVIAKDKMLLGCVGLWLISTAVILYVL